MKYAAGENVMSCIQSAECDKATKIGVTERSEDELRREVMSPTFTSAWMLTATREGNAKACDEKLY